MLERDGSEQGSSGGQATSGTQTSDCATDANPKSEICNPQLAAEPPLWQRISGLTPEAEPKMSRSERRHAIRKLYKEYEKRVREALAEHDNDAEKDERSFLWDPIATICFELGIARRKLSALTKELTGMAAHEVVDKIRAEKLKDALREDLARMCRRNFNAGEVDSNRDDLHKFLVRHRRSNCFDISEYATQLGFSSYSRYRRGCMLAHNGATPRQLEFDILCEFDRYYYIADSLYQRDYFLTDARCRYDRLQCAGQPYNDRWAKARRDNREWLEQMRGLLGISEKYAAHAEVENHPPLTEDEQAEKARREKQALEAQELQRKREEESAKKMKEWAELAKKKNSGAQ